VPTTPAPVSLRRSFAWTLAGNIVLGASQWAVLSLIAKLGGGEMLGQYALALALAAPVAMLSHMNLRSVLATDTSRRHPFGDYLAVRLATTAFGLAAIALLAFVVRRSPPVSAAVLLLGLSLSSENVSDIYYGLMQRRERMDQIARSMMGRAVVSVGALGLALWLTRELAPAVLALAAGRIVILLTYDRPVGSQGEDLARTTARARWEIARSALPLGVSLLLVSLTANIPRYAIQHHLGTRDVGVFAAVVTFMTAGATIVNALGQSATPRLASQFSAGDIPGFRRLALRLAGLSLLLGLLGVLGVVLAGRFVLAVIYRPEFAAHAGLLAAIMGAGICTYLAVALGYVVTSARSFAVQPPLLAAVAITSAAASWTLIPLMGLNGAALAVAIAASVQIAGEIWILRLAMNRQAASA
jgi:O-antigen/teichoic acid export membrane protein